MIRSTCDASGGRTSRVWVVPRDMDGAITCRATSCLHCTGLFAHNWPLAEIYGRDGDGHYDASTYIYLCKKCVWYRSVVDRAGTATIIVWVTCMRFFSEKLASRQHTFHGTMIFGIPTNNNQLSAKYVCTLGKILVLWISSVNKKSHNELDYIICWS
jgi:hypothetical protein